jgi:hypothetical protein
MKKARPEGAMVAVHRIAAMMAISGILLAAPAARAGTLTNVSLSSYFNGSWTSWVNGSQSAAAATLLLAGVAGVGIVGRRRGEKRN